MEATVGSASKEYSDAAVDSRQAEIDTNHVQDGTTHNGIDETGPISNGFLQGIRLAALVVCLCLGTLLVAIDTMILAVAVPQISTEFQSLDDVGWYGSAYLLTITALQPSIGNIYKYFNVKVTYLISIIIFEVGSILCAAAPSSPVFIFGRAVAGLGAAGLYQGAITIIGHTVPLAKRPTFLSIVFSVFGLATCFGPPLGGAFTSNVTWRWCFWINVPIGVPVFFLILIFFKLPVSSKDRSLSLKDKILHLDLIGATILIAAVCCLLLALQWGGITLAWNSSQVIGLFVGFGMLILVFILIQWRLEEKATIPLRFLRQRSIIMGACFSFFINGSNYIDGYFLPFYFQAAQNVSATISGVRYISLAIPEMGAIMITGALVTKFRHYVPFMIVGAILAAIGTGLLSTIGLDTPTARWAGFMVLTGLGIGTGIQLPLTAVQVVSSKDDAPISSGVIVFFSQLGGAIAVPVAETIFVGSISSQVAAQAFPGISPEAVVHAGATELGSLTADPKILRLLQGAYSLGVSKTLYLATAMAAAALPFAVGMEWRTVVENAGETKVT